MPIAAMRIPDPDSQHRSESDIELRRGGDDDEPGRVVR